MSRHRAPARRATVGAALLLVLAVCAFAAMSIGAFRPLGANAAEDPVRCTLTVPADPLSARGLATPYRLSGHGCVETEPGHSAFVQATVIDTATGEVSNYTPLVVTRGTQPAVQPALPQLPAHAVVGIWFGFNGDELALRSEHHSLRSGACVNGAGGTIFGQYAYCNAPAFFAAANRAITMGQLSVPALGMGSDGLPCPTTRDFGIVDQDQSDNVTSKYVAVGGRTAQATTANIADLQGGVVLTNASDNGLVDNRVDPALGCKPWTVPDLGDDATRSNSLALNELQAATYQAAPSALVPLTDPMAMDDGRKSQAKTDAYRAGVNMPPVSMDPGQSPARYCRFMTDRGWERLQVDRAVFTAAASPDATADSLYTFIGARLAGSYDELNCAHLLKKANPFHVAMQGAVAVGISKGHAPAPKTRAKPAPTASESPVASERKARPTPTATTTPAPTPTATATDPADAAQPVTDPEAAAPTPAPDSSPSTSPTPTPTPTVASSAAPPSPGSSPTANPSPSPPPAG